MTTKFSFNKQLFDCENVYYPSEDSYFLAEQTFSSKSLVKNWLRDKNRTAIDLGCGSGIQSLNLFFKGASKVTAIDLNKEALETTQKNCEHAGFKGKIETLESNLFENFKGKVDVIVFNPPYVVSDEIKYLDLDGGKQGRETLDLFLKEFPKYLSEKGKCFFIQTNLNGYEKTNEILAKQKFKGEIIAKKGSFFEELGVYSCSRIDY